jgi:hypothetical protein
VFRLQLTPLVPCWTFANRVFCCVQTSLEFGDLSIIVLVESEVGFHPLTPSFFFSARLSTFFGNYVCVCYICEAKTPVDAVAFSI